MAWDSASRTPLITRLVPPPPKTPEGFAAWAVGDDHPRSIVVLPAITPTATYAQHQRYIARLIADATGHCPLCGQSAGLSLDPERDRALWRVAPLVIEVSHVNGCPATFDDEDKHLFPVFTKENGS